MTDYLVIPEPEAEVPALGPDPLAAFYDPVQVTSTVCVSPAELVVHPEPTHPMIEAVFGTCAIFVAVVVWAWAVHYFGNIALARRWIKYRFAEIMRN